MRNPCLDPLRRAGPCLLATVALLLLAGCGSSSSAPAPAPLPYSTTHEIALSTTTPLSGVTTLSVDIPDAASSIGIALQGTNSNYKFIDHGYLLSPTAYITNPSGAPVPLSFNYTDSDGDLVNDPGNFGSLIADTQTTALFFPNDGSTPSLPAGVYHFPIGSLNSFGDALESDTLQPYVYYKTATATKPTLNLNVFVVSGVGGLTTVPAVQADAEIQGALTVLRNVYENNTNTAIQLAITLDLVSDSNFAALDTDAERDLLFSSYPTSPANDAMNIFIVTALNYTDPGVIGQAARIPGPFNRQGTLHSGTVAEYQGDATGTILGFILAHEFGHFLGLYHTSQTDAAQSAIIGMDPISDTPICTTSDISNAGSIDGCPDRTNLMFPIVADEPNPAVSAGQGTVIRLNPAISVP
jgi:Metallo-peptidase family M12B Reprolysin-like